MDQEGGSETNSSQQQTKATSWTGNVWIQDQWTEEDKSQARDRLLDASAVSSRQQHNHLHQQQHQREEEERHEQRTQAFREFRRNASTNWNVFYEQNKTNFFKDRHYLHKAFPKEFGWLYQNAQSENGARVDGDGDGDGCDSSEVVTCSGDDGVDKKKDALTIVEIGCGVGNAILPLLEQHTELVKQYDEDSASSSPPPRLHIHCLDFAPTAIRLLKEDPRFRSAAGEGRGTAHVYDLSSTHPSTIFIGSSDETRHSTPEVLANSADVAILLFCLSAVGPHPGPSLERAARHVIDMLKPGGTLVLRDYGRLDEAQMKLGAADKELGQNFYRKGDGTGCYYFELNDLKTLFVNEGPNDDKLEMLELDYIQRVYRNRGDGTTRRRVWVQGRFRKPAIAASREGERNAAVKGPNASADALKQVLETTVDRWDEYYRALSLERPSRSVPSNLLQMFPEDFRHWQPSTKRGKRRRPPQPSLESQSAKLSELTIVDLGCGPGNDTLLDLVEQQQLRYEEEQRQESSSDSPDHSKPPILNVHFLDASDEALQKLSSDPRYQSAAFNGESTKDARSTAATVKSQVCNLASATAAAHLEQCADVVLLLFTLSAIGPYRLQHELLDETHYSGTVNAVQNATRMLKPGGVLLFRDYARYDDDQLQFNSVVGARLCDNFYERGLDATHYNKSVSSTNGTGCYFFDLEEVRQLITSAGLEVIQLEYVTRIYKKSGKNGRDCSKNGGAVERRRIWVHGKFRKPNI